MHRDLHSITLIVTAAAAAGMAALIVVALATDPLLAPATDLQPASIANACGTTQLASRCPQDGASPERMAEASVRDARGS